MSDLFTFDVITEAVCKRIAAEGALVTFTRSEKMFVIFQETLNTALIKVIKTWRSQSN